ncbi:unnamed protein product, partial [Didymodactylos carnosus]
TVAHIRRETQLNGNEFRTTFSNDDYSSIVPETITIEGKDSIETDIYGSTDDLNNQLVLVNNKDSCNCNEIMAKVIDSNTWLLQDIKTNRYFYADKSRIQFLNKPETEGTTFVARFTESTTILANLSYLTYGISWNPSYFVTVSNDNEGTLKAYANIKNGHGQKFEVEQTSLIWGNVPLGGSHMDKRPLFEAAHLSTITNTGEINGLHTYKLDGGYTLYAKSVKTIPFVDVKIKLSYQVKAAAYLSSGASEGVYQRYYEITPDQYLPNGMVSFHQNGLFLGQSSLANSPQNVTQVLTLGNDEEVRYKVDVTVTKHVEENGQVKQQSSDVVVTLDNKKDKPVRTTFVINGSGKNLVLNTSNNDVKINSNIISIQTTLEQNEQRTYKFSVEENF